MVCTILTYVYVDFWAPKASKSEEKQKEAKNEKDKQKALEVKAGKTGEKSKKD